MSFDFMALLPFIQFPLLEKKDDCGFALWSKRIENHKKNNNGKSSRVRDSTASDIKITIMISIYWLSKTSSFMSSEFQKSL